MILCILFLPTDSQGQCLVLINKHKWQKQGPGYITLKVFFMEPAPDGNEEQILSWMREWSKHCGVEFKRTTFIVDSSIRITFKKGKSILKLCCATREFLHCNEL